MKTKIRVIMGVLAPNHNEKLASGVELDQKVVVAIDETEMEIIAAALRVRSGLAAGSIQPRL